MPEKTTLSAYRARQMAQTFGEVILQNAAAALGPADGIGPGKYQRPAARVAGDLLALQVLGQPRVVQVQAAAGRCAPAGQGQPGCKTLNCIYDFSQCALR